MTLEPERLRPGLGGYSPEASRPEEAALIQNLELDRDDVWRPRPGRTTRATYGDNILHVSAHPNDTHLMVVEGGDLRFVSATAYTDAVVSASWPSAGFIKHAVGNTGSASVWTACKAATTDAAAALQVVSAAGSNSTPSNVTGNWVEAYGQLLFTTKPNEFQWSAINDCTTWSALDAEPVNQRLGTCIGMLTLGESQALLLGDRSCSLLTGAVEDLFAQQDFTGLTCIPYGLTNVICGKSCVVAGPGPALYLVSGSGQVQRIDQPIYRDLLTVTNWDNTMAWWDPVLDEYCLVSYDLSKTWRYSLQRGIWVSLESAAVIGVGLKQTSSSGTPKARRFVGVGTRLLELDDSIYTDNSSAFTCALETYITDRGMPDRRKQLNRVYVGGVGTWTVTLYYRNALEGSWSTLAASATVSAPGYAYFAANVYRERKIRLEATAASGVYLRDVHVYEELIGGEV